MPMGNTLSSEIAALLATVDPDDYAAGAQNSDWIDLGLYDQVMAVVMAGTIGTGSTLDAKLTQATSSGGAGEKDITGKAITQLTQAGSDSDKQAVINCRADELDIANDFRFVRLVQTGGTGSPATTVDHSAVLVGFGARYEPASDGDLASVAEIVN